MAVLINQGNGFGKSTQNSGTKIYRILPPLAGNRTRILLTKVTTTGTAETMTVMRSIGQTTVTTAALAGQADVIVTADPGPAGNGIAGGDICLLRTNSDGITRKYVVSSWASVSRTITFTTNLIVAVAPGDILWDMGIESDTDPITGEAQQTYNLPAASNPQTTTFEDTTGSGVGFNASNGVYQPLLISINNITNAATIEEVVYVNTVP